MTEPKYQLRMARNNNDVLAVQRLRYDVFISELGGDGPLVDHESGLERDEFDEICQHLLLVTITDGKEQVVGTYRLLLDEVAKKSGSRFYCEAEFDITPLKQSGQKLLELGRSCIHKDHRGGNAMTYLWTGLYRYIVENKVEIAFGAASIPGCDARKLEPILSFLFTNYPAPAPFRVTSLQQTEATPNAPSKIMNRVDLVKQIPPLLKAYLRLGGYVGQGAFHDYSFNVTDVFMLLDVENIPEDKKHGLKLTEQL